MKTVAILQSNYIPWKGYFDLIARVDEFILFDDMQFTKRDWRNRNKIKTTSGLKWLTVPVITKGKYTQKIFETMILDHSWADQHWNAFLHNYKSSDYFSEVLAILEPVYKNPVAFKTISELNSCLISLICRYLKIDTLISSSSGYTLSPGKTQKLVDLCLQSNATHYLSGPSAKDYIDPTLFQGKNIDLTWMDYDGYPEYQQLWGAFEHNVSIIDLLFNCGPLSSNYLKYV